MNYVLKNTLVIGILLGTIGRTTFGQFVVP